MTRTLHLDKPLAVFDIEATGINRKTDRIIDLCIIKWLPNGETETLNYRLNPGMPIPAESTEIHGITDSDVADSPAFESVAQEILEQLTGCDLAGFNLIHFDIPMLQEEFLRAGLSFNPDDYRVLDAQKIYHRREPRDLSAALKFYAGKEHENAHGAEADVIATMEVIKGQIAMYEDLPVDMDQLDTYCNQRDPSWVDRTGRLKWLNEKVVVNFGKQQGQPLEQLAKSEPGFLKWIIKNDFPRDTQEIVRHFLEGGTSVWFKPTS